MAGYLGISKINGVAIANVAKDGGVTKANIWSIAGEQRQASLFRVLFNQNWSSYTAGKNSASFSVTGNGTSSGQVYFQYDNHSAGDQYNFAFNKLNTTSSKIFACGLSEATAFGSGNNTLNTAMPPGTGAQSVTTSAYGSTNSTIYIGINMPNASSDTLEITDLIVTKV